MVEALPEKDCKPVKMFGCAKFKSKLMVPLVVTGFVPPKERVLLGVDSVTDVTVPEPPPRHVPLIAKQPATSEIPFANVDVAFERRVVVAVPF